MDKTDYKIIAAFCLFFGVSLVATGFIGIGYSVGHFYPFREFGGFLCLIGCVLGYAGVVLLMKARES